MISRHHLADTNAIAETSMNNRYYLLININRYLFAFSFPDEAVPKAAKILQVAPSFQQLHELIESTVMEVNDLEMLMSR